MPRVSTPIPNTYDSQSRPIAMATIRQVCGLLSIPGNISVIYAGAAEQIPQVGSTLNANGEPSIFNSNTRISAEVHEDAIEERVLGMGVYKQENAPFFVDADLDVRLWPVYSSQEMVISFTLRTENRVQAQRFRQEALIKTGMNRQENVLAIDYHYPIPYEYLYLLKHIHTLRETQGGYGDTFDKWVADHLSKKATNLTTLTGQKPMLVVAERQIRTIGYFDFSAQPQPEEKDNDTGAHLLRFEYHLNYDKVIAATAHYPLVVHNQLIDSMWYEVPHASGNIVDPERSYAVGSMGRHVMDHIVKLNECHCAPVTGIAIPNFDDWAPKTVHPSSTTVATIMLGMDLNDPTLAVDLKDIPDYQIDPDILAFLKTEHLYLNSFSRSIAYVSLYRGDVPIDDGSLIIDDQLVVRTNLPMDVRQSYHIRLALINDLFFLTSDARERFRGAGQACVKILSTLQGTLLNEGYQPTLLGGTVVRREDFDRIGQNINDRRYRERHGGSVRVMLTIGNFLIATHGRTEYASFDAQADSAASSGSLASASGGTPIPAADIPC